MTKIYTCVILLGTMFQLVAAQCPTKNCKCDPVKREVSCKQGVCDDNIQEIASNINKTTLKLVLQGNLTTLGGYFLIPSLKELTLNDNNFTSIPRNLSVMFANLDTLLLKGNEIQEISAKDFNGLNRLEKIDLEENVLTKLSDGVFGFLRNLKQLSINKNKIQSVSKDAFRGLENLQILGLDNNMIPSIVPGVFDHFTTQSLKKIWLSNNRIKTIPNGLFEKLQKFSLLKLSENNISTIGNRAFQNTEIENVDMNGNNLTSVPASAFENSTFKIIALTENPLYCDCRIADFLITANLSFFIVGSCKEPKEFAGRNLGDFALARQSLCTACELNNTCLNNAVCVPVNRTEISCDCVDNFSGELCEFAPVCMNSPCKNKGVCLRTGKDSYKCNCAGGYKGRHCKEGGTKILIGIIVGVVGLVVLLVVVAYLVVRCRRNQAHAQI